MEIKIVIRIKNKKKDSESLGYLAFEDHIDQHVEVHDYKCLKFINN